MKYRAGFMAWLAANAQYLDVAEPNDYNVLAYARDLQIDRRLGDARDIEYQVAARIRDQANSLLEGKVRRNAMVVDLTLDRDVTLAGLFAFRGSDASGRMVIVTTTFDCVGHQMVVHTIVRRRNRGGPFRLGAGGGASDGAILLYGR